MTRAPMNNATTWEWRARERELLLASLGCMLMGFILALAALPVGGRDLVAIDLLPLLIYALVLGALHLGLVVLGSRADPALVVATAFLSGLGLLVQTRLGTFDHAGPLALDRMVLPGGMLIMLGACAAFMNGRYRMLARWPWLWAALALLLVATVLATGQRFRGALFGFGNTTPTEVLKVLVVLFLAGFIDRHVRDLARSRGWLVLPRWPRLWPLLAFWVTLSALVVLQRDLGMLAILGVVLVVMLTAGTRRNGYLFYGGLIAAAAGYAVLTLFEHAQRRISVWLDPFQDPTGDGWQILQGLSGLYAGGLWGEGFGAGAPDFTPIANSDFIYSVIGEELGLIGTTLLLLFYLVLLQRGLAIAKATRDGFGRLLAIGLTTMLAVQTLLNVGGVTKLIPLTGVTLPLLSHGGASLLTTFTALGLLLAISDSPGGASRVGKPGGRAQRQPKARKTKRLPRAAS